MTLTLDLSPTEEARLTAAAQQKGLAPAALVKALVTEHLPMPADPPEDPMLALFAQWAQEDAQKTPEETAQENRTCEQFHANITPSVTAPGRGGCSDGPHNRVRHVPSQHRYQASGGG